jgi:hypothetical protein
VSLVDQITRAAGQPLTARIGVVVSTAPLRINLQGTIIGAPNLGIVGTTPSLGDNVLLLGQAVKGAKTSGSSWVCMGTINPAP